MAIILSSNAFANEDDIVINKKECEKLIRLHQFSSPDYVPGVDVRGNKVKDANHNFENIIKIPDEISFNIGIDLGEKYGKGKYEGTASFGKVTLKGRNLFWNGQKLAKNEKDEVLKACQEQYTSKP